MYQLGYNSLQDYKDNYPNGCTVPALLIQLDRSSADYNIALGMFVRHMLLIDM